MKITKGEITQLTKAIAVLQDVIARAQAEPEIVTTSDQPKRKRRAGKELVAFRKMLIAERKKGTPVSELAEKHGVSAAYIYQLPQR